MKNNTLLLALMGAGMIWITSCSTLSNASRHGFTSGYYTLDTVGGTADVYAHITAEQITVYQQVNKRPSTSPFLNISLPRNDSLPAHPLVFKKQSLDIDLTSILLKYRPAVQGLPPQLSTDLNMAVYAGWRFDRYKLGAQRDPLGRKHIASSSLGYDVGIFAGMGSTPVNPFTTNSRTTHDYSGMIAQAGFAGFLETEIASFGLAVGFDYLLNRDRSIWIYHNKPWVGFVVGLAIN